MLKGEVRSVYNFGILHGNRKFKVVVSFVEMNRWEDLSRWKNWKWFKGEKGVNERLIHRENFIIFAIHDTVTYRYC